MNRNLKKESKIRKLFYKMKYQEDCENESRKLILWSKNVRLKVKVETSFGGGCCSTLTLSIHTWILNSNFSICICICWSSTKTAQITPENHLFVFSNKNGSLNSSWPLHCIRSHLNAQRCIRPPKNLIFQEVTRCHEFRVNHCQLTRHLHYMEA